MSRYRLVIAPEVAAVIRALHPDLKRSVRSALDAIADAPSIGEPLRGELAGLWRYRVRRFRIVYAPDRAARVVRVVAVGPRRSIYEEVAASGCDPHRSRAGRRARSRVDSMVELDGIGACRRENPVHPNFRLSHTREHLAASAL
jgi:mRNA interferase RelE/StbE